MRREIAKELVAAARHMIDGIPSEEIDTHMRNLINRLEEATNKADENLKEYYVITSVSKDDIRQAIEGTEKITKEEEDRIRLMDEAEMESLAEDMGEDYVNQLYWPSLKTIFRDRYL